MRVGFTGTRKGMTAEQRRTVKDLLLRLGITEGHHGDCVGSDSDFHDICDEIACETGRKVRMVIHPPVNGVFRAFRAGDEVLPHKTHFARNRDVVDTTDVLVGTPPASFELPKGGTWYTIRYARKHHKSRCIVWPSGNMTKEPA